MTTIQPDTDERDLTHDDLVVLTSWMADNGYDAHDVAYAVEKQWKFLSELAQARAALAEEGVTRSP